MKNISTIIAALSADEKKLHADLIKECKVREKQIIENCEKTRNDLIKFSQAMNETYQNILKIQESINIIKDAHSNFKGDFHLNLLRNLPEERFLLLNYYFSKQL